MTERILKVGIDPSKAESGARRAAAAMGTVKKGAKGAADATKNLETRFERAKSQMLSFKGVVAGIGFASLVAGILSVTRAAKGFETAMAEVFTLVGSQDEFDRLRKNVVAVNKEFGGAAPQQAKALYQIISAGASNAAEATAILQASNKLAIGGVTELATAADGLTSILNAYAGKVGSATSVSDALFVAMRAGKTTIGELSSSLGKVAPLAAATGVSLDELLASVSALTKGGISTSESVTGMRAILAAVAKPTKEAADLAKQLGIDFNAAGLEAKGFSGFLSELVAATGGSTEQLSLLFGGVEALVPAMALSGAAGKDFTAILEDMTTKAGSTDEAFEKIFNTADRQIDRFLSQVGAMGIQFGTAIIDKMLPALIALNENFDDIIYAAKLAIVVVGTAGLTGVMIKYGIVLKQTAQLQLALAAAQGISSWRALGFIVYDAAKAFAALNLAMLLNPVGAVVAGIAGAIAILFSFREHIQGATENVITLRDIGVASWELITEALEPLLTRMEGFINLMTRAKDAVVNLASAGMNFLRGGDGTEVDVIAEGASAGKSVFDKIAERTDKIAAQRIEIEKTATSISNGADQQDKLAKAIAKANKEAESQKLIMQESSKAFAENLTQMDQQLNILELQSQGREKEASLMREQIRLTKQLGRELSQNELSLLRERIDKQEKLNDQLDRQKNLVDESKDAAERMQKPFIDAAERIQKGFADAFTNVFKNGISSFKDLTDVVKQSFARMLGELATLALQQQIIIPIATSVAGSFGSSGGSIAQALGGGAGSAAGGGGFGGLGSLSQLFGGGSRLSGLGASIAGGVNSFGASIGFGGVSPNFVGPLLPGTGIGANAGALTGASLTSVLGAAGLGFLGGGFLGQIGGNVQNGSIGGGLGAGLGMAVGGPLGSLIGGSLGGLVGGFFGNDKNYPFSRANIGVTNGELGVVSTSTLDGGPTSYVVELGNIVADSVNQFSKIIGATGVASGGGVIGYSSGNFLPKGYFGSGGPDGLQKGVSDVDEAIRVAILGVISESSFSGVSSDINSVIQKSLSADASLEELISNVQFAQAFLDGSLFEQEGAITAAEQALSALNFTFDELATKADDLGLNVQLVEDQRQSALLSLVSGFNDQISNQILAFTDPLQLQMDALIKSQEARVAEAEALGVDLVEVERLNGLERKLVLEQFNDDLLNLYDDLTTGSSSISSPAQRLADAEALFNEVSQSAQGGDTGARSDLSAVARSFLSASEGFFGSSGGFIDDFNQVTSLLEGLLGDTPRFADGGITSRLSFAGERGPEAVVPLPDGRTIPVKIAGGFSEDVVNELRRLAQMIAKLETQSQDIQKGQAVNISEMSGNISRLANNLEAGGF